MQPGFPSGKKRARAALTFGFAGNILIPATAMRSLHGGSRRTRRRQNFQPQRAR